MPQILMSAVWSLTLALMGGVRMHSAASGVCAGLDINCRTTPARVTSSSASLNLLPSVHNASLQLLSAEEP